MSKLINIRMDESKLARLDDWSQREGVTRAEAMNRALDLLLEPGRAVVPVLEGEGEPITNSLSPAAKEKRQKAKAAKRAELAADCVAVLPEMPDAMRRKMATPPVGHHFGCSCLRCQLHRGERKDAVLVGGASVTQLPTVAEVRQPKALPAPKGK